MILEPAFPPLFTGHGVVADQSAFDIACRCAAEKSHGAGDLFWSAAESVAAMAIILEPDVPRPRALQMGHLAMVALGDSLGALLPPKVTIEYRWPDTLLISGGEAGRIAITAPPCAQADVPEWLVVAGEVCMFFDADSPEPGEMAHTTCLAEEGGAELTSTDVLQSFAAHFLSWLNTWSEEGFEPIRRQWIFRAVGRSDRGWIREKEQLIEAGKVELTDNGDLIVTTGGRRRRLDYAAELPPHHSAPTLG